MKEKKDKVFWKWLPAYLKALCFSTGSHYSQSFISWLRTVENFKISFGEGWLLVVTLRTRFAFQEFPEFFFLFSERKTDLEAIYSHRRKKNILAEWEIQLPSWSVMDLWFHIALSWPWPEPFEILWIGSFVEVNFENLLWDRMNSLWYAGVKRSKGPFRIWLISPRAISILQRCKAVRK